MQIAVPDDSRNEPVEVERTEDEMYYDKLCNDEKFQEKIINGLLDMEEYTSMLNVTTKEKDMQMIGQELIIRQEVYARIMERIAPIVKDEDDVL